MTGVRLASARLAARSANLSTIEEQVLLRVAVDDSFVKTANPSGLQYSAGYEMTLDAASLGRSRTVHFNRANEALDKSITADPDFGAKMESLIPGVKAAVSRTGGRSDPPGWTWHHVSTATAEGRVGVMRLVPTAQHSVGSIFQKVLHPGGAGGYSEWAIPAGAPKN